MDFERAQAEVFRLHACGDYRKALAVVEGLGPEHGAKAAFWRACLLSRAGDGDGALAALEGAVAGGHWYADAALADDDLAAVRGEPRFAALTATSDANQAAYVERSRPPLMVEAAGPGRGTLVALHRASGSPARARPHWEAAAASGWRLVLPWAEHAVESDAHVWLDPTLSSLDRAAIRRVGRALPAGDGPLVLAGFSQGAAAALVLSLEEEVAAAAVLVVGSTDRYEEAAAGARPPAGLAIRFVIGEEERHFEAARRCAADLGRRGADVAVDVRPGLGHAFPGGWAAELPGLLRILVA